MPLQPKPSFIPGVPQPKWETAEQLELDLKAAGYREPLTQERLSKLRLRARSSSPLQRYNAMVGSREFLARLADVRLTPRLKRDLRVEAQLLSRHYPPEPELRGIVERGMGYRPPGKTGTIPEPPTMPVL